MTKKDPLAPIKKPISRLSADQIEWRHDLIKEIYNRLTLSPLPYRTQCEILQIVKRRLDDIPKGKITNHNPKPPKA